MTIEPFYHAVQQLPLFPTKVCTACGKDKLLHADFYKGHARCKTCYNTSETRRQASRNYDIAHREQRRQKCRDYYATHHEQRQQYRRDYRAAHQELVHQQDRDYHTKRREQEMQQKRIYNATHREQNRQKNRAWRQANLLKKAENSMRYYARKKSASIETIRYEYILARDGMYCYICEQAILPHQKINFDHVIPLTRGGPHSEENIKVTHAVCNRRKRDKLIDEMPACDRYGIIE